MIITFNKTDLSSKTKIRSKLGDYISMFSEASGYSEDEIFHLILSAIRTHEWGIIKPERYGTRERYNLNIQKAQDWIREKVVPNTVTIKADEIDLLKLMVFSLAMPYKMLKGETRATITEKVQRGNERYFGRIFSDIFNERIGEISFRKFVKQNLGRDISLDWEISTEISAFKSDIIGSKEIVSIKSTDTLESIWAEAPPDANYGIFVKVAIPKDFFMKILAHISSLKKLLRFVEEKLDKNDSINDLLKFIEDTAYKEEMTIRAYVCGFYETSTGTLRDKGQELPFLGGVFEVFEEKHMTECSKLKYSHDDWSRLLSTILPCD